MYGLPYVEAGKSTWTLIKDRGVDAIVNDSLIGNVLSLGCILISLLSCAASLLVASVMRIVLDTLEWVLLGFAGFFIGFMVSAVVTSVIESANNAFFVCLAEDPQALASYNPELFEKIRQTYPEVTTPV
ncbi:putative choline transporter, neither null mutation nor overexpression affects choline transport [Entomophthora muscae]|uniref:Choline transporter, neither null mutation nor overexpression affects choline transport n=1 Tax=Entomophthora muscae TaxID=34485 RepID=A0ACC2RF40_9FUNG|nr:putative choline transporter, neither null mutation nor overexpression affects choline transport [Entomophthora muscae]